MRSSPFLVVVARVFQQRIAPLILANGVFHNRARFRVLLRPDAARVPQRINREKKKPGHDKYHLLKFFDGTETKKAAIPRGMTAITGQCLFTSPCFFSQRRF
jgi:hypothetical protein